jgi:hypothetical protein
MERLFRKILRRTTKRDVLRFTLDTVGVFCASTLIWEHCFTIQRSEGPSMYPTFHTRGDWLLISRFHRQGEGIQVGDVVRFYHPSFLGVNGAKRVLGMPGDFVCKDPPFSTDVGRGTTHTKEGTAAVVAAAAATEGEVRDGAMGEPEMIQVSIWTFSSLLSVASIHFCSHLPSGRGNPKKENSTRKCLQS